jgi:hypothetical protein
LLAIGNVKQWHSHGNKLALIVGHLKCANVMSSDVGFGAIDLFDCPKIASMGRTIVVVEAVGDGKGASSVQDIRCEIGIIVLPSREHERGVCHDGSVVCRPFNVGEVAILLI